MIPARIPALDGVRGVAIALVLVFHFSFPFAETSELARAVKAVFLRGWVGVDLFFVLSGYLITRGLLEKAPDAPLGERLRLFYARRALRIFPLYYLVLAVGSAVALLGARRPPSLLFWLYLHNYAQALEPNVTEWTGHLWSLAIEEQFYLVWPFFVLLVPERGRASATATLLALGIALRLVLTLVVFRGRPIDEMLYRLTPTHADGLLLGALIAMGRRWHVPALVLSGTVFFVPSLLATGDDTWTAIARGTEAFAVGGLMMCLVTLAVDGTLSAPLKALMNLPLLRSFGRVSYGMYLFHWPLVAISLPLLTRTAARLPPAAGVAFSLLVIAVGTMLVYGLASASYRYFEAPFLRSSKGNRP